MSDGLLTDDELASWRRVVWALGTDTDRRRLEAYEALLAERHEYVVKLDALREQIDEIEGG